MYRFDNLHGSGKYSRVRGGKRYLQGRVYFGDSHFAAEFLRLGTVFRRSSIGRGHDVFYCYDAAVILCLYRFMAGKRGISRFRDNI